MNKLAQESFSRIFKALADPTRQRVLELLRRNGEMSVNDIASHFNLAQPTISQHLKVLIGAEALKMRKDGQRVFYRICNVEMYDAMETFIKAYKQQVKAARHE
jgi:DNA-binding transcriptional ArsR family regulator